MPHRLLTDQMFELVFNELPGLEANLCYFFLVSPMVDGFAHYDSNTLIYVLHHLARHIHWTTEKVPPSHRQARPLTPPSHCMHAEEV